ncbi:MAG: hypothetical protein NTV62_04160 [Candidatus Gribaldobacteria bacterium]|nr:hypothetical protein [Candidatus Gribaldobacteria bacterium]
MGDAPIATEKELLATNQPITADVIKIGHHGSKTSTSLDLLAKVQPKVAVISCGQNNSYGHPQPIVLQNLLESGINVLRTDERGDVTIRSNGTYLTF